MNDDDLRAAFARLDALLALNPQPGTPDGDELDALIDRITHEEARQ